MTVAPRLITSLDEVLDDYDALLCDVWGVVHNGVSRFDSACSALMRARDTGRAVVLVTNSPRTNGHVVAFLDALEVPSAAWDRIVTSGDVTRTLIAEGPRRMFHLGTDEDLQLYEGLDVELVEEFEASGVVCTGLFDDSTEEPSDYADMLRRFRARDLPFICANPDIVVERGDELVWCAGALARDYGQLGGRTLVAGKPHRPIYDAALDVAGDLLGRPLDRARVLAIGDGMLTDVKGAVGQGIDALFISGGIHAAEYMAENHTDTDRLAAFLDRNGFAPASIMNRLA